MKTLLLALSAIFLVGVSGFPSMQHVGKAPIDAVLLIPQGDAIFPVQLPVVRSYQAPADFLINTDEDNAVEEEQWNESPVEQDPPAHLASSSGRSRRSTQPGAPAPGGQQQGQQSGDRGHVDIGVSRGEGGSRRVDARGEGNVWQSNDGRGRVDVHGHYSRDYGGRYGTGRPQYGGGIRYQHRF